MNSNVLLTRRHFFGRSATGIGLAALAGLLEQDGLLASPSEPGGGPRPGILRALHHAPKAKRVIYLFMSGGPSHIDLLDYKPALRRHHGTELPASVRMGQRVTGMTAGQSSFPCVYPMFNFRRQGQCGTWISDLLPHIGSVADDLCVIKSMTTEAINHDPAVTYIQTGSQQPGRPALGSWLSYGIGTENQNLPAFIVMVSQGSGNRTDQPLFSRLWGAGFLPSDHQGVRFRTGRDPVLYLSNPAGIDDGARRDMLDATRDLNRLAAEAFGDPEINTRIEQYEMAFRMQASVPSLRDFASEPQRVLDMYGTRGADGSFAANCLMARRLAERGVRFIQLYHRDWDHHGSVRSHMAGSASEVDRAAAALVRDLKERGMLDDTLIIFGGEFGRTPMAQGDGRDHHIKGFSIWLAGGGIKPGITYGATDEFGYNAAENIFPVHDLHATMLHLLGIDHLRLTYRFQGRDFRLTDVHGEVVNDMLA